MIQLLNSGNRTLPQFAVRTFNLFLFPLVFWTSLPLSIATVLPEFEQPVWTVCLYGSVMFAVILAGVWLALKFAAASGPIFQLILALILSIQIFMQQNSAAAAAVICSGACIGILITLTARSINK